MKDKYDFILQLLNKSKLTPKQKERILMLSTEEIKKEKVGGKKLEQRVKRIEEALLTSKKDNIKSLKGVFRKDEITANPKDVADFMSLFNKRDGLKYLTHDYDENNEFDIDKFLISANRVFNEKTKELNIPPSLWRIVKQFAFDSKQTEWTSISENFNNTIPLTIGWATKELRKWSKQHHLHPIRNEEYRKIINHFKRITRIESPNLEKLIDNILDSVFKKDINNYDIEKTDLSKADFYSHVFFLKTAFETIFEEIKKRSDSPRKKKISIKYERSSTDDYYLRKIIITHHNSFPTNELKLILQEWKEKGNIGKIYEKLNGYCHWSVETLIENTPTRVNILRDKETSEHEYIKDEPEGFTHILTFYYK